MATSSTLTPKTLFVVGAGASKEVGLPIGSELKSSVVRVLTLRQDPRGRETGDEIILRALNVLAERAPEKLHSYYRACQHICNAMPQVISIDNFINQHRNDKHIEQCGKLAIVRAILEAESKSSLYVRAD